MARKKTTVTTKRSYGPIKRQISNISNTTTSNQTWDKKSQSKKAKVGEEKFCIPRIVIDTIIKEILQSVTKNKEVMIEEEAVEILHEIAELHLIKNFNAYELSRIHRNAEIVKIKDVVACKMILEKSLEEFI